jgi:uncharacterized SAM-binding protein YcdF (DUF218 family)
MQRTTACCGLLRRRECLVPTWRGWVLLLASCALLAVVLVRTVYPFLAVEDPKPDGVLVVEGWASDRVLQFAVGEFHRGHYAKLYATGGPVELGGPLSEYKTYAELAAATLLKLGLNTNDVQAVPATAVRRDRTYNSAVFLKKWLREHGVAAATFNLITVGPHARRSRLMFEKALGEGAVVGVVAIPSDEYDPGQWWRSSAGVRTVIGEAMAYGYARFLFHPPKE